MGAISLDIETTVQAIWTIVSQIKDEKRTGKERAKDAQLLVYHALSIHPALDYMRSPTGAFSDVDWYTELRAPFRSVIFRKLVQNHHFRLTALLGEIGTRARIMLLLLWIIGHRLNDDQITRLLSTALDNSLSRAELGALPDELSQLEDVKRTLIDLRQMIRTRLPLPPDRNPFAGPGYQIENEDMSLPRSGLWGYELPPAERYEYDVRSDPSILLRRLHPKVIIPQTKLTLLLIQWATSVFGLGKKVKSHGEVDADAYWNADPPDDEELSDSELSTSDSSVYMSFEHGYAEAPYDFPFQDLPLEDWIHLRYCQVYEVHDWVHSSLTRTLLFNSFSLTGRLPDMLEVRTAVHLVRRLLLILPEDIWNYMESFILARAYFLWQDNDKILPHSLNFSSSFRVREGSVAFSGMIKWFESQPIILERPTGFEDIRVFLVDPNRICPDAPDVLSLPLLREMAYGVDEENPGPNALPSLSTTDCMCGECNDIHVHMASNPDFFRDHYFSVVENASSRGCDALARVWEPLLARAEAWFEGLLGKIESSFALPWASDARMGPAVIEIANIMGLTIGSDPPTDALLRFVVTLSSMLSEFPLAPPIPLPTNGLGYIVKLRYSADREEYCPEGDDSDRVIEHVLFTAGNWLYDLAGLEGITLIYSSDDLAIEYYSLNPGKFSAVCMPDFHADFPIHTPPRHAPNAMPIADPVRTDEGNMSAAMTIMLSNCRGHGYPLLSVKDPAAVTVRGALAALLRVSADERVVETVWKPSIHLGARCEHTDRYRVMTHCAPTAHDVLSLMDPDDGTAPQKDWMRLLEMESLQERCQEVLRNMMAVQQRRTSALQQAGSLMERHHACIVRCGSSDGPMDAVIVLAASLHKKVYGIHHQCVLD